jgi:hypothetical protein
MAFRRRTGRRARSRKKVSRAEMVQFAKASFAHQVAHLQEYSSYQRWYRRLGRQLLRVPGVRPLLGWAVRP